MSEQSQRWVGSSTPSKGSRSIAKAFLLSLGVHAALVGVLLGSLFSQTPSSQRVLAQPELLVDLAPVAHATTAATSAPQAAHPTLESAQQKITARSDPRVRSHAPVEQAAARLPDLAESDKGPSNPAHDVDVPVAAGEPNQQHGALPIELRVLDWLARYRTYPLAARRARIEGMVQLHVTLMPDGRLVDARVERSSGHPLLDQAALDLLARAAPLPSDFGSTRTEQIQLQLPIVYRMLASST